MNQTKVASGGFSLIEVMIVLVIIGVLLLVATPGYQESMRKSHRAGGMRDLMELVSRQERFYAQNSRYTNVIKTPTGLNFMPNDDDDDDPDKPTLSSEGHYDLSVALCKNPDQVDFSTCYNLLATPRGKQAEDACGTLNVDSKGKRGHSGATELTCW
jgi:type IV pilus assembly protein PilE